MNKPAKVWRLVFPAVLILSLWAGAGVYAGPAAVYSALANSIAVLLSDAAGLPYARKIPLAVSEPAEIRQVIADDLALTIPGLSTDPSTRRAAYGAVQTGAARYSLQRRKLYICPLALDSGRAMAGIGPSEFERVLPLIMMNELARALLDQNYDLGGRFKGNRHPGEATALRGLMEGYCAYWTDWLSADAESDDGTRRLAQSWAGGRLIRPDPAVYPAFDDSDPLRTLGRNFISYINRRGGTWALQRAFTDTPRSIMDLFDPEAFLLRAENADPGHRQMKERLLGIASALGADRDEMAQEQPARILRKFALSPRLLDPPAVGLGLRKTDEDSGTDIIILLIRTSPTPAIPLDSLFSGTMRPIRDITRLPGIRLEPWSHCLMVSKSGQMTVQTGRLFDSGNAAGMIYAVAGQWGPWVLLVSARGNLGDHASVMNSLQQLPSLLSSPPGDG